MIHGSAFLWAVLFVFIFFEKKKTQQYFFTFPFSKSVNTAYQQNTQKRKQSQNDFKIKFIFL